MSSAVIFGGTGLVGSYLIKTLINDEYYTKVKVFTRSEIDITNSKLEIINTNFDNLEEVKDLILADCCFFCIGTTKKNSPNKKDGLKIPRLSKSNRFNSSSTKPLNLKYSPLFSEFAKPDETKT